MASMETRETHHPATIDDLLRTPDDGNKYELVDGEIVVSPAGLRHSGVGSRILHILMRFLDESPCGYAFGADVGLVLPNGNLRSPDVCFIEKSKFPEGDLPDSFGEVVPDLVVEVLSPNDRMRQVADKIGEFLDAGVGLVWLVDPASKTVTVYRSLSDARQLKGDDVLTADPVLPGFSARVSDFFSC